MSTQPAPDDAGLALELGRIHELARTLVFDSGRVDDVVQESWLRLQRAPAESRGNPRGWTATIVRNVARQFARAERRRARREQEVARPELQPDTRELEGRAELHKRLVDAVLALEDPYRSTLLARFFDGRAPREIARERGVPVATVESWQKRGLAELRRRLDADFGDRSSWCLALLPLARLAGDGAAAWTPAKLAGAALLLVSLAGSGAWLFFKRPAAEPGARASAALESSLAVSSPGTRLVLPEGESARADASLPPPEAPKLALRAADGTSAADARVRWARLPGGERGEARSDARGLAELPAPGRYALAVEPEQGLGTLATLELGSAGAELVLPPSGALELEFVDAQGLPVEGVELGLLDAGVGPGAGLRAAGAGAESHESVESFLASRPRPGSVHGEELRWSSVVWMLGARTLASAGVDCAWPAIELRRRSGASGRVVWNALPPADSYGIELHSPHFPLREPGGKTRGLPAPTLQQVGPFSITAGGTTRLRVELAPAGGVRGVLDTRGSVDPSAVELEVTTLVRESPQVTGREVLARTRPDAQGRFEFPALPAGASTLRAQWGSSEERWFVLAPLEIRAGSALDLGTFAPLDVPPLDVEAALVDPQGMLLDPQRVYASAAPSARADVVLGSARAGDPDWNFSFRLEYGRRCRLHGLGLARASFQLAPFLESEPPTFFLPSPWMRAGEEAVECDLPAREVLRLAIVARELAAAELELLLPEGATQFPEELAGIALDPDGADWRARVDAAGHATARLRPGRYRIHVARMPGSVRGPGLAADEVLVLGAGARVRVPLTRGCAIDGVVRVPPEDSMRFVLAGFEREHSRSSTWSAQLDEQGRFHLSGLPPRTELLLWTSWREGRRELRVRTGEAGETLSVELR